MDKVNGKIMAIDVRGGIIDSISEFIEKEGYQLIMVNEIEDVVETAREEKPKALLAVVDVFDDKIWDACKELKENFDTRKISLIMMSASKEENDVIRALQLGADDYVIMPFSSKSLVARIKAVIARKEKIEGKRIRVKDIEIDLDEHRVKKSGKPIDLTYIQFKLLYLLASRRDSVFSRKEILEKVWGRKVYVTNRTVDVHIKRLREKLGEYKYPSQYIETIHGTGYRFL